MSYTTEVSADRAETLLKRVGQQVQLLGRTNIALCRYLSEVRWATHDGTPIWSSFGSWEEYVEHEVRMHYTRGTACVRVWDKLHREWGFKETELADIGITNLIAVSRVPFESKKDARAWVKRARDMSCCQLEREIQGDYQDVEAVAFQIPTEASRALKRILDAYKDKFNTDNRGDVLVSIVRAWDKEQRRKR